MKRLFRAGLLTVMTLLAAMLLAGCGGASNAPAGGGSANAPDGSAPAALSGMIKRNHPSPFTKLSEEVFDQRIAELERDWDTLGSDKDAACYALRELVASIGDEHTQIASADGEIGPQLPFMAMAYDGHWIIVQAQSEYSELVGKELTAVNGAAMTELYEGLKPIISYDTEQWAKSQFTQEFRLMKNLKYIGAAEDLDSVAVTVKDWSTGEESTLETKALTDSYDYRTAVMFPSFAPTLAQSGYYYANRLEDGTIFLQYNVCADNPDMSMNDFARTLEEQALDTPPEKFIVDLRHNAGGDSSVIKPLLKTLKKFQKKGSELYCLIGMDTFSSAVMNAADLKKMGAVLVGETAGGIMGFGEVRSLELPDGFVLYCSTKNFSGYAGIKGELSPDIKVTQTVEDFLAGRDSAVEYIIGAPVNGR